MAQITGLKERQMALRDIQSKLKLLEPLNVFLQAKNDTNEYTVSFTGVKASIICEDKAIIDDFVKAYKKKVADQIFQLAEQYSITLDEDDNKVINELFVPSAVKKIKKQEA